MRKTNLAVAKKVFLSAVLFLAAASAQASTTYTFKWKIDKLPFDLKMALAPLSEKSRISETGIATSKIQLPIQKQITDGTLTLAKSEQAILYLFLKNTGKKTIRFAVAPHSTEPGESALGFSFSCLCNGHIYTVGPGEVWYRIMRLRANQHQTDGKVELEHVIFEVKK